MFEKYKYFFNIDPDYFPQVTASVISENPDMWKKYYPHQTFVKLMHDTVSMLTRKQKLSIWVEGAYGTGKSHAVLTLKKLLDASETDTRQYFEKYNLNSDLYNQFQGVKNSGTILTIHRYGSSNIRSDHNLVFAIQESIEEALKQRGIENKGTSALKNSVLQWLEDQDHRSFFNSLILGRYKDYFVGDDVDKVIQKLKNYDYDSDELMELMNKIFKVADEEGIRAMTLDAKGLSEWIKEIIIANNLQAIVFIWDEFTEFFNNNKRSLTGFQEIAEISETDPFYLMIVTHKSAGLFSDVDKDQKRILDRFIKPTCIIELPENMAFQLMGAAMEKSPDPAIQEEWRSIVADLYSRTENSRQLVKDTVGISDTELENILPIHPYAALLLKHISSAFDSNQRSMFDFIKNDRGDEIKGFQWFINNNGPDDDNPLLTIDMLWDFFYERGKEYLAPDIRAILDCYPRVAQKKLSSDEKRVLKCALLLQSISQKVGDAVEIFLPNDRNINNAFEGSDLDHGRAAHIAERLVNYEILYKKQIGTGAYQYSALVNSSDLAAVEKIKEDVRRTSTSTLISQGELSESISFSGALKQRYFFKEVSAADFDATIRQIRGQQVNLGNKIVAITSFAKDDDESAVIGKKIKNALNDGSFDMVFIDTSITPLGKDGFDQYVEAMANAKYQRGKDNSQANQFESNAKDVLKKWRNRIASGEFIIYTNDNPEGERVATVNALGDALARINKHKYPDCLEGEYKVTDNLYAASSLKVGVECGICRETSGVFKSSNPTTKLETALSEAWDDEKYWETKPLLLISRIKRAVDEKIGKSFVEEGRVSIASVYDMLKERPYGFMACNFTAFIMGFILKEYTDGSYSWSDGLTSDLLNITKMKEMVDEVIKLQITPNPRYRDKYIVTMTQEEKSFNEATSIGFGIPSHLCTSIEQTRDRIRNRMKELSFPIWSLKSITKNESLETDCAIIDRLIDLYTSLANNNSSVTHQSDSDIAMAIGKTCMEHTAAANDLSKLLVQEKCTKGMEVYLQSFDEGILPELAEEVNDMGQYINVLKEKFDADAANWVWNKDTADQKIRETILEYKIIAESNKIIAPANSYAKIVREWCDRSNNIKISYYAGKLSFGKSEKLLGMLCDIKESGSLRDSDKEQFLQALLSCGQEYKYFYSNQIDVFQDVCAYYLNDFDSNGKSEIFKLIPAGCFTLSKSDYFSMVESKVEEYKETQGSLKLKALWKEKTNTDTPRIWSIKNRMPILCLIDEKEIPKAKRALGVVNQNNPDAVSVKKATEYLENASFFEKMKDQHICDESFRKCILKEYSILFDSIEEVKDYLNRCVDEEPYDWFPSPSVDSAILKMADAKYNAGGNVIALDAVDQMKPDDVKQYLKDLIKDNMRVGVEIIKNR